MGLSDQQLWDALSGGAPEQSSAAATQLRLRLRKALAKGFGSALSESDLDEWTQDSLARVMEKLPSFAGRSQFATWAISIAVNTVLGELRKRKHEHLSWESIQETGASLLEAASEQPTAATRLARQQGAHLLEQTIRETLTERQREALGAELAGLSLMEIARRLGSSRGAVYKLMHDARLRLRNAFEEQGVSLDDLLAAAEVNP